MIAVAAPWARPVRWASTPLAVGAGLVLACTGGSQGRTTAATPACQGSTCGDAGGTAGTTGTATSGGSTGGGGTTGSGTGTAPPDPNQLVTTATLQYVGRFVDDPNGGRRFSWPGSAVLAHFNGTGVAVTLEELGSPDGANRDAPLNNFYEVIIDDGAPTSLAASSGLRRYPLAQGLAAGSHTLSLRRRTEASVGATRVVGLDVTGGQLTPWTRTVSRRLLFIGDSITCGYGVEGTSSSCTFSPATENVAKSAGLRAAAALNADAHVVAWSGRGAYRNNDGSTVDVVPALVNRALAADATSRWNPAAFVPQGIVINLGTNDFYTGVPPAAAFTGAIAALVQGLRQQYPAATIWLVVGPMLSDIYPAGQMAYSTARTDLRAVISQLNDPKVLLLELATLAEGQYGCDYHPADAADAAMATQMAHVLGPALGWQ